MKNFNLEEYLSTLNNYLNAANFDSIGLVDHTFDKFEEVLQSTVNKFAPLKKASRREKKISQKHWLIFELLKKIKTKNKLFKQLHKKFDKDNFEKYKNKEML